MHSLTNQAGNYYNGYIVLYKEYIYYNTYTRIYI